MPTSASSVYEVPPGPPKPGELPPIPGSNNPGVPTVPTSPPPPVDNAGTLPLTGFDGLVVLVAAALAAAIAFALRKVSNDRSG